jgi:hypothetical protein
MGFVVVKFHSLDVQCGMLNEPSGDKASIQQTSHFVITIMLHVLVLL